MRTSLVCLLLLAAGCPGPAPAGREGAAGPPANQGAAADATTCKEAQATLNGFRNATPPSYRSEATYVVREVVPPFVAGAAPIPYADLQGGKRPVEIPASADPPEGAVEQVAAELEAPHAYVAADPSAPARLVAALHAATDPAIELRLVVVTRTPEEALALHAEALPRTPLDLQRRRAELEAADAAAVTAELARHVGECGQLLRTHTLLEHGAGADVMGEATAEALAACQCRGVALDAYIGVLTLALMPPPRFGWLKIDPAVLAALGKDATVADLAATLGRGARTRPRADRSGATPGTPGRRAR